jgi:hypothetical protein
MWEDKLEKYGRCYITEYWVAYYQNKINSLSFKSKKIIIEEITPITPQEEEENREIEIKRLLKKRRLKKITPTEQLLLDTYLELSNKQLDGWVKQ